MNTITSEKSQKSIKQQTANVLLHLGSTVYLKGVSQGDIQTE